MQNSAKWRFRRFLVATFSCVIPMKLMAPIFHIEFDALQLLLKRFCKIPPNGYFGYFWWLLLVASFKWNLWYQFFTQNLMLYNFYIRFFSKFRQVAILAILAIFGGYFWLRYSNEACGTNFPHRIWFSTSFTNEVFRNSANWRFWLFWWLLLVEFTKY